jgi:hypothetical protein
MEKAQVIGSISAPEVRIQAVRMVLEHGGEHGSQWEAIRSIAAKIVPVRRCVGGRGTRNATRDKTGRPPYGRSILSPLLTGAPGVLLQTRTVLCGLPAGSSLRC